MRFQPYLITRASRPHPSTSLPLCRRLHCATYGPFRDRPGRSCIDRNRSSLTLSHTPSGVPFSGFLLSFSTAGTCSRTTPRANSRNISHCSPLEASARTGHRHHLRSGLSLSLVAGFICLGLVVCLLRPSQPEPLDAVEDPPEFAVAMPAEVLPGRPGNLTPDQEEKLRQLWNLIFQVCAVRPDGTAADVPGDANVAADKAESVKGEKPKKKGRSVFSRKGKKDAEGDSVASGLSNGAITPIKDSEDDKYGQIKHFYETIASQSPESIRATIWSMVKHDHPDALVLRFLRARKWDVEKALVMLISTMNWRAQEMHVDDDIMKNGEAAAAEAEKGNDAAAAKLSQDFLAQIRMGKSFLHGVDKNGRPVCVVRVRLHKQGEQAEESLERYTVYIIETARMLLHPPVDTATIVFDMTGFSMANMDYTPVKFMVKCFEANYPESLGAVLVHKAPWIFQGIWKIIKGWLDPVVAGKVHFTNNRKDMEEFIAPNHILKELDGDEDWQYKYLEPVPGENDKMKDTETRDRLLATREQLYADYEAATIEWIQTSEDEQSHKIKARREAIAAKLREDYWILDPYLRARSLYDRTGVLQLGGKLDYYPKPEEVEIVQLNGKMASAVVTSAEESSAVDTSADDVD